MTKGDLSGLWHQQMLSLPPDPGDPWPCLHSARLAPVAEQFGVSL